MFGRAAFTVDMYDEWEGRNRTQPVHLTMDHQGINTTPSLERVSSPQAGSQSWNVPAASHLASYLPDAAGPSALYEEFGDSQRLGHSVPLLTPAMAIKLDKLRLIRRTGYYTLAPIGVNKTMAQLDYESQDVEDDDCNVAQAENLNVNVSTSIYQDAPSVIPQPGTEHDLDANIEDGDASRSFEASSDLSEDDDAMVNGTRARNIAFQSHESDTQLVSSGIAIQTSTTPGTTEISANVINCEPSDVEMVIEDD